MRLSKNFYTRDAKTVAIELLGKTIVRKFSDGRELRFTINETEAYLGEFDLACHARKGRTARTETMYFEGGVLYVYLIYGMYWMLNVVTGPKDHAEAVLIRGIGELNGPGKLTRKLEITKEFNGESLIDSERILIESSEIVPQYTTTPRIGIDYAGDYWKSQLLRFCLINNTDKTTVHLKKSEA